MQTSFALYWIFGVAAAVAVWRLATAKRRRPTFAATIDGPESDAAHAVMNVAMALMAWPAAAHISHAALWILAAALAFRLVLGGFSRRAPRSPSAMGSTIYHLFSVLAMIYGMSALGHGASHAMMSGGGMHDMHAQTAGTRWVPLLLGILFFADGLLTLGGLFAPELVLKATRAMAATEAQHPAVPPKHWRRAYFGTAFAHVTMDFGMAWLLLR